MSYSADNGNPGRGDTIKPPGTSFSRLRLYSPAAQVSRDHLIIADAHSHAAFAFHRVAAEEATAGTAEMGKFYDETGRELYMGAGDREHD